MQAGRAPLLLLLVAVASTPGRAAADSPCRACHEERFQAGVTHFPAAAGLCETCHQVKPQHLEDGDTGAVTKIRSAEKTCLTCHAQRLPGRGRTLASIRWKVEETGGGHGVASSAGQREGRNVGRECLACHVAHPRAGGGLLAKGSIEALCFGCHRQQDFPETSPGRRAHPGTRHPAGGGQDPAQPGRPFTCVSCHEPHGSTQAALFRYRPIKGAPEPARLCGHCHGEAMGVARPAASPPWNEQDARP